MRTLARIAIFVCALALCLPGGAVAKERDNYVFFKIGPYGFRDTEPDTNTHPRPGAEVSFGRFITPVFALEAAAGYFQPEFSTEYKYPMEYSQDVQATVVPLTVTAKLATPGRVRFYLGLGYGYYLMKFRGDLYSSKLGWMTVDSDDAVTAIHMPVGLMIGVGEEMFMGFELRIIDTLNDATIEGRGPGGQVTEEIDLNGIAFSFGLGMRF